MFRQFSVSSLHRHGGDIFEDYLPELRGQRAVQLYKEMGNNAVIGAVLHAVKMTLRRVRWFAVSQGTKDSEAQDFLDECMDDMSLTWNDFVDQSLSMLQYGWSVFEEVYKVRRGSGKRPGPPTANSRYTDGRVGWRKFEFIGQDTLAPGSSWEFDEVDGSLRGLNQQPPIGSLYKALPVSNIAIPISKLILFRTTTERNNPEGRSILRPMYESWFYVKNLVEIEAISAERLGAGFPVFYLGDDVSKGATFDADIAEFRKMVRNVRVDEQMGMVIPFAKMGQGMAREGGGVLFELVSPPARGSISFSDIIQRHEKRMAMVGLAQFIHLGMDNIGSQALADVTTDFFQIAVAAWADAIKETINRFAVDRLFALNPEFRMEDHPIIDHSDVANPDLKVVADYINKTVGAQVITPDDRLEESLRRLAGFPDKDETTAIQVMTEVDGEGGERVSRKEKAKPANQPTNQRNQNPVAQKPQEPPTPTPRQPMRASEDNMNITEMLAVLDFAEKFSARAQKDKHHEDDKSLKMMEQAIALINTALSLRQQPAPQPTIPTIQQMPLPIPIPIPSSNVGMDDKFLEKFAEVFQQPVPVPPPAPVINVHVPEQQPPTVNITVPPAAPPEIRVEVPAPAIEVNVPASPAPTVNVAPPDVMVRNEIQLPHEVASRKKVVRDSMGRIDEVTENTRYQ